MAIVNVNGISGINSITAQSNALNFYDSTGNTLSIGASVSGNITGNVTGNVNATGVSTFSGGLLVGTGASISSPATNVLTLGTNNTESVRINSTGVGIGTTNSSSKLQVQGTIGLGASDDLESIFSGGRTKLTSSASGFVINHNDNSATIFQNQGVERARISASGNLGIGTNNPFAKTHIEINAAAGASSGSAAALWLRNANQTANNSATIFAGNDSSAACAAINFVHANYSNNQGFISFDTRENALTYNSNAMKIDAYGRVTTPYQPMAYVTYTGAALVRNNIIPFTAVTNQGNHWNNSSYGFTCPVAGIYHASLNMTGNSTQSVQVQSHIRKNGSNVATSYYPGGPVSISILCSANDTIDFVYNHDNAGYNGATPAYASVHLVG